MKNRAEVIKVSIFEYDKEIEEKKLREAEFEAGKEEGIQEGRQEGIRVGIIAVLRLAEKIHLNETETIQQLCESMNLSVEEAQKCYETYRNKNL